MEIKFILLLHNSCLLTYLRRSVLLLVIVFSGHSSLACHNSAVSFNSITSNGDETYDVSIEVCAGGLETTYGFELTINGANINSINTASLTQLSTITPTQTGANVVEYGDYNNTGTPIFNQGTSNCWDVSLTLDGYPTSVSMYGTEQSFGFCGGTATAPVLPPCDADAGANQVFCAGSGSVIIGADPVTTIAGAGYSWSPAVGSGTIVTSGNPNNKEAININPI